MTARTVAILIGLLGLVVARRSEAYPQYQLSIDQTCTSCHLSPAGGALLDENGLNVAETTAWKSGNPSFLHGALGEPSWLHLSGGVRGAAGLIGNGTLVAAAYPMQAEVYAAAIRGNFSFVAIGGVRSPQDGGSLAHVPWSREHYAMWRQHPDSPFGLYVRAGRFMPVFGLRLAEHPVYTQRYGGAPLFGETYAAAVEYVGKQLELHATGFVHDPLASAVEHGNGGAFYSEYRITEHAAIGAEARYAKSSDESRTIGGATAKLYVPDLDLLLLGEGEYVHQTIAAGGTIDQLLGYVLASRPLGAGLLLDVGLGHFTENLNVSHLYRDCVDANLHWFESSHLELLLTTRLELLDRGRGPNGGYALVQLHYRL